MPDTAPPSLPERYTRFVARNAWKVIIAGGLMMIVAALLMRKLELRTAFSELLPSDDPGVVTMNKTGERMGDLSLLLVGVRSPDRAATLRYAEAVTEKLRALPPKTIALATYHVKDVKAFFERNKWLYINEDDLTAIRDRLRTEIGKRKNPLMISLDDDEESLDQLRTRVGEKDQLGGRFPDGVFSTAGGEYVWVAALPPGGMFGERGGEDLFHAAQQIVRDVDPKSFHPEMEVHLNGPVATLIANRAAVERDILWVTLTCVGVVALSILAFFRRWRALPLIGAPAVLGTVMAFAGAQLAFGYVNSSTAFLGSIILGNGINYAIIFMGRYQEQRAAGDAPQTALERALAGVVRGTGMAAICASAAYASLMLTSFRGFYQFGVMGAMGVLFCWIATFTLLPAMIHVLDRGAAADRGRTAPLSLGWLGRLLVRRTGLVLTAAVAVTIVCTVGLQHFRKDPFEYDFRKLRADVPTTKADEDFGKSQDDLFGRWPSPTFVLADSIDEVEPIRAAIRRQDNQGRCPEATTAGHHVIGDIITVFDILPGTPEVQQRKLALISEIRKLRNDPALDVATDKEKEQLSKVNPPGDLKVLGPMDLPPLARRPFTEADGTVGRVVLFYPVDEGLSIWDGRALQCIASVVQWLDLPDKHKVVDTSGGAVVFASMIRSILHDWPRATAASLLSVVLLTLLVMRPRKAAAKAMATMLLGVLWMVGGAGLTSVAGGDYEVKITFLNFIALPITFGIGAEYALNVVSRFQETKDMVRSVMSTGSAVALCSWTTIVGYGSLLAARNHALRGFGAMAILGEVACLLAAIVALPSLVLFLQKRRQG